MLLHLLCLLDGPRQVQRCSPLAGPAYIAHEVPDSLFVVRVYVWTIDTWTHDACLQPAASTITYWSMNLCVCMWYRPTVQHQVEANVATGKPGTTVASPASSCTLGTYKLFNLSACFRVCWSKTGHQLERRIQKEIKYDRFHRLRRRSGLGTRGASAFFRFIIDQVINPFLSAEDWSPWVFVRTAPSARDESCLIFIYRYN